MSSFEAEDRRAKYAVMPKSSNEGKVSFTYFRFIKNSTNLPKILISDGEARAKKAEN